MIVTATNKEQKVVKNKLSLDNIRYFRTGIGPNNVKNSLKTIKRRPIKYILNTGICGGINSEINQGEVIIPEYVRRKGGQEKLKVNKLNKIVKDGTLITSEKPIKSKADKLEIKQQDEGILAVDMEAFYVAQFCQAHSIPFYVVKACSDNSREVNKDEIINNLDQILGNVIPAVKSIIMEQK